MSDDLFAVPGETPSAPTSLSWRWELVKSHWSMSPVERDRGKLYVDEIAKRKGDPYLLRIWDFYDEMQSGIHVDHSFAPLAEAYEIMTDRPKARLYIEGLVLNGVTPAAISAQNGIAQSAIKAFEVLYFDVRPYLHLESWVCEQVFSGDVISRLNRSDINLIGRRIAWLLGAGVFHAMFGGGRSSPELLAAADQAVISVTRKTAVLRAMTRGHMDEELDVSLVQDIIQAGRAAAGGGGSGEGGFDARHANAAITLLSQATLSVADPSLESNLQLPARDPRTVDVVADLVRSRLAKPVEALS